MSEAISYLATDYTDFHRCCSGGCVSRRTNKIGAWHKRLYNSLNKDFGSTPTRMSTLRQINFSDAGIVVEQRANIFHNVEADVCNFSGAQPFQHFATLKRDR